MRNYSTKWGNLWTRSVVVLLSLTMLATSACDDILDIEPVNQIPGDKAVESVADLEALVISMYNGLSGGHFYGSNLFVYSDLLADDAEVDETRLSDFGTREIYNRATTIQINPLRDTWKYAYQAINRANLVISIIDENRLSGAEYEAKKTRFKAEAYFVRALCHFELVRYWAQPYDANAPGSNSQMGVPYRTVATESIDQDLNMARNSVEEVYANMIADLGQSENLFAQAGISVSGERASLMAATALKARILFYKGDYAGAAQAALSVINSGTFSMGTDLLAPFDAEGTTRPEEVIFQIAFTSINQYSNGLPGSYSRINNNPVFKYADQALYDSYNPTDLRKSAWFIPQPITGKAFIKKHDLTGSLMNNIPVLRLGEMHLIRAEAVLLSGGNVQDALDSYNAVRQRAFGANFVPETGTQDLLAKVQLERRWELCYENDRLHNLKRMKLPLRNGIAFNDPTVLFKIPQEEIAGNSLIVQNP